MKNIVFAVCIVCLSCTAEWEDLYVMDHDITWEDPGDIVVWVKDNIEYLSDQDVWGQEDYWQLPHQTYNKRTGDCEDVALLIMYLLWEDGEETEMLLVKKDGDLHALVQHGTTWYASGDYSVPKDEYKIVDVLSYEEALSAGYAHRYEG